MSSPRIVVSDEAEHEALVMVDNCPIPFGFRQLKHPELSGAAGARHYLLWVERNKRRLEELEGLGHLHLYMEHAERLQVAVNEFTRLQESGVWVHADRLLDAATFSEDVFAAFVAAIGSIHAICGGQGVAMFEEAMAAQEGCNPWAALASVQAALEAQEVAPARRARMHA